MNAMTYLKQNNKNVKAFTKATIASSCLNLNYLSAISALTVHK